MRVAFAGGLLASLCLLLPAMPAAASTAVEITATTPCHARPDCNDWPQYRKTLRPFLRGSMANVQDDADPSGATTRSPQLAYRQLKAAYYQDPEFACRQPLTSRFLEHLWQIPPRTMACAAQVPFRLRGIHSLDEVRWIDPARVESVHLLFAGESGTTFSRFGHVALRLVVCAPRRAETGPDCDEDVLEHLVLGFSAGVGDPSISVWKGLFGGYDIRLFATDFYETYQQYTIDEFRSLSSVPIELSADQRAFLVRVLSEAHWHYDNRYRFFSSNCATELQWLLNMATMAAGTAAQPLLAHQRIRPDRLFADALQLPAFEAAVLDDLQLAEHRGHYFPSAEAYYQHALGVVAERLPEALQQQLQRPEDWLGRGAGFRASHLNTLLAGDSAEAIHAAQAFLVLETWGGRKLQRKLISDMSTQNGQQLMVALHGEANATGDDDSARDCLAALLSLDTDGADGIPVAGSPQLTSRCSGNRRSLSTRLAELVRASMDTAGNLDRYRPLLTEIDAIGSNIKTAEKYLADHRIVSSEG